MGWLLYFRDTDGVITVQDHSGGDTRYVGVVWCPHPAIQTGSTWGSTGRGCPLRGGLCMEMCACKKKSR